MAECKTVFFGPRHGPNTRKPSCTKIRLRLSKLVAPSLVLFVCVSVHVFVVAGFGRSCTPHTHTHSVHCTILFLLSFERKRRRKKKNVSKAIFSLLGCCYVLFLFRFFISLLLFLI